MPFMLPSCLEALRRLNFHAEIASFGYDERVPLCEERDRWLDVSVNWNTILCTSIPHMSQQLAVDSIMVERQTLYL